MAINETVFTGRKFRMCIDNTPGNKKWNVFSWWTKAKDVEFEDGTTVQGKLGNFKGVTTNENQVAGYAADITLLKSIKTSLTNLITSVSNLVNSINTRLGGLRFYEDSTGKYVVGADSVPKKLGSTTMCIKELYGQWDNSDSVTQIVVDTQNWSSLSFGEITTYSPDSDGVVIILGNGVEIRRENATSLANKSLSISQYATVTIRVWYAKLFDVIFTS